MITPAKTIEVRPQPIGIFPAPAANLILPGVENNLGALQSLLQGDLSGEMPKEWRFFIAAAQGDVVESLAFISVSISPLAIYNQFVLSPTEEGFRSAQESLTGDLAELLLVAAYAAGITDTLTLADSLSLDGELLAQALATQAAADIERKDTSSAVKKLKIAVAAARDSSPLLASILLSQQVDLMATLPGFSPPLASQDYKEAIRLAGDSKLPMLVAELHTKRGMLLQEMATGRSAMLEAVVSYQTALQNGITEKDHPELFAQLQNNLGLAYLSTPTLESSNQLRTGIAVQSFRHALKVYTIEEHPDMWASVSMNLANALQYAPSSHQEDNLIQAVETYEEVLQVRSRAKDPVAYALVLFNQANALAHLGIFKPALDKLAEAYKLFHWYDHIEQANTARDLVEEINQQLEENNQSIEATAN